jgi:formylglycine-generating enzyme required for sulfatase activity
MLRIYIVTLVICCLLSKSVAQNYDSIFVQAIAGTDLRFNMNFIPGGVSLIGSPDTEEKRTEDEGPQVEVNLEPFYMLETEVTWDLFEFFLDKEKSKLIDFEDEAAKLGVDAISRPSQPYEDPTFGMGKNGYPAASMTQFSALNFCKWLTGVTGKFYRLPTEAEWEHACRAGSSSVYGFGDDLAQLDDYGWYYDNSDDAYHKTAQKKPNAWGLYDMHGNVSEWTLDQYQADYYTTLEKSINTPWRRPDLLHPRSVRGGSYDDDPEELRSANRIESSFNWKKRDPQIPKSYWWNTDSPFVGFRIVTPAKELTQEEIQQFWSMVLDE